ncbi:hypothetical protein OIO90_001412 [Microbotryomycetes sp. JL221]|nr:hypothetical protein OIO90_001412 [Microbotryomycetes sp. JL221]
MLTTPLEENKILHGGAFPRFKESRQRSQVVDDDRHNINLVPTHQVNNDRHLLRPLSTVSSMSTQSRTSSLSLSERRRSALIQYEQDETFCSAIMRAEAALRKSEKSRQHDDDQTRQFNKFWSHSRTLYQAHQNTESVLRKARSAPLEQAVDSTIRDSTGALPVAYRRNPTQSLLPRQSVPLLVPSYLQAPDEPTSKFSCSSAESKVGSLRTRALKMSQSFLNKAPSHLNLRRGGSTSNTLRTDDVMTQEQAHVTWEQGTNNGDQQRQACKLRAKETTSDSSPTKPLSLRDTFKRIKSSRNHARENSGSSSAHAKSDSVDGSILTASSSSKHGSHISTSTSSSKKSWFSAKLEKFVHRKRSSIQEETQEDELKTARASLQIRGPINVAPLPERVRPPSRIPISAVFPDAAHRRSQQSMAPKSLSIRGSSDDTTMSGRFVSPTIRCAANPPQSAAQRRVSRDRISDLLPPIDLEPKLISDNKTPERSFEPASPGRFRDFIPSAPASSSPEKTSQGLPLPQSPQQRNSLYDRSCNDEPSPKKRALGPEQVIGMLHWHETRAENQTIRDDSIVEPKRATTDLAALLSGLEETEDVSRRIDSLSNQTRQQSQEMATLVPAASFDSIRSTASDVPSDLTQLIVAVSDHISEYSTQIFDEDGDHLMTFVRSDETDSTITSSNESDSVPLPLQEYALRHQQQHHSGAVEGSPSCSLNGASSTGPLSSHSPQSTLDEEQETRDSFGGLASNAVAASVALRDMLARSQDLKHDKVESPDVDNVDISPRSVLEMERPTVGEKMLEHVDFAVSLASLVPNLSPEQPTLYNDLPVSVGRHGSQGHEDATSSSEGWSQVGRGSPVPLPAHLPRASMARYSQTVAGPILPLPLEAVFDHVDSLDNVIHATARPTESKQTMTSTEGSSSQSTNVSISSLPTSPCPIPHRRRVPMLTGHRQRLASLSGFKFPPVSRKLGGNGNTSNNDEPQMQGNTSPYKQAFNPLQEFVRRKSGSDSEAGDGRIKNGLSPSPRSRGARSQHGKHSGSTGSSSFVSLFVDPHQPSTSLPNNTPLGSNKWKGRHSRQVSAASNISQSIIFENESDQENGQVPTHSSTVPFGRSERTTVPEEIVFDLQNEFGIPSRPTSPSSVTFKTQDDKSRVSQLTNEASSINNDSVDLGASHRGTALKIDDTVDKMFEEIHRMMDFDEERSQKIMRNWVQFESEAQDEIRSSRWKWLDSEGSKLALAQFIIPTRVRDILFLILDSQTRFQSSKQSFYKTSLLGFRSPLIYPAHAPSPGTPVLSDMSMQVDLDDLVDVKLSTQPQSIPVTAVERQRSTARQVLLNKSVNHFTEPSLEESKVSPFTALPPKLKMRSKTFKSSLSTNETNYNSIDNQNSTTTKRKSEVDISFLGHELKISKRRQNQLNASKRKLEGIEFNEFEKKQFDQEETIEFHQEDQIENYSIFESNSFEPVKFEK